MTIKNAVETSGMERADAEVLLATILGKDRSWLLAHGDDALSEERIDLWEKWIARRKQGEPVAHITGMKSFYGHEFLVTKDTLIPRPATEGLVDVALDILRGRKYGKGSTPIDTEIVAAYSVTKPVDEKILVLDIGTGSGCIAISLAHAERDLNFLATDCDINALDIALQNARAHRVENRVTFVHGDLLEPLSHIRKPFLVVSNPPYIPLGASLERDVMNFEPHTALFGGSDGSDFVRRLATQAKEHPYCVGIVMECREEQANHIIED